MNVQQMNKESQDSGALGFSLIELLITISILGILTSIALVNLTSSRTRSRLLATTRDMENWITEQRRYVMSHNLTCRITVDTVNKRLISTIDDGSEPCKGLSSDPQTDVFELSKNFGDGSEKLSISTRNYDQELDSSDQSRVIRIQHQGFSQHHLLNSDKILVDESQDNNQDILEILLAHEDLKKQRCIKYIFPTGMTRDGLTDGSSSSTECNYENSF